MSPSESRPGPRKMDALFFEKRAPPQTRWPELSEDPRSLPEHAHYRCAKPGRRRKKSGGYLVGQPADFKTKNVRKSFTQLAQQTAHHLRRTRQCSIQLRCI